MEQTTPLTPDPTTPSPTTPSPAAPAVTARDKPWVMRTYSGHSTAKASNALYRTNLAKGQTGLSIAFDLPTQTGYAPDSPEAAGEVGKVGVPVAHRGHMNELMDSIPVETMNTSIIDQRPMKSSTRQARVRSSRWAGLPVWVAVRM